MILDMIQEWFKELLIDGIISNLTGMFDTLNTKVGEIAGEVGMTPAAWNSSIFNMIRNLSGDGDVPIAGIILTFVMCYGSDPADRREEQPPRRCMLIARTFKSSLLQRWSAHLWQNSMTEARA